MTTFAPREYPIMEICLCGASHTPERFVEGDITGGRRPGSAIGTKEAKSRIWLLIQGWDLATYGLIRQPVGEPLDPTGVYDPKAASYALFDKRRYCIPFTRLVSVFPSFDAARARDLADTYQPFFTLDTDNHQWLTDTAPLAAEGLVFDKVNGVYI